MDPFTYEQLIEENNFLVSKNSRYPLLDGIPSFVTKIKNNDQAKVKDAFDYKWMNTEFGQDDHEFEVKLTKIIIDFLGISKDDLSIFNDKIVLDVGIGSGSSARLWASRAKEFHGIDISNAIYKAPNALRTTKSIPILSQADLNHLPYLDNSFDALVSAGVLHHTPNTKLALKNILKKLKLNGTCWFYVYKKKAPLREFSDDYIREKIGSLSPEQVIEEMKKITNFGKSLHEQGLQIYIPNDIEILGIKKGNYDLQRFIYQNFFKCFWNDSWEFDYSNLVNFDWYFPKFSWRHTEDEIRQWCQEFNLEIIFLRETESGYSCLTIKK